jgi:hypothetical protein
MVRLSGQSLVDVHRLAAHEPLKLFGQRHRIAPAHFASVRRAPRARLINQVNEKTQDGYIQRTELLPVR